MRERRQQGTEREDKGSTRRRARREKSRQAAAERVCLAMKLPEQCSPVDIWVASDSVIHIRNRWTVRHHSEESSPR